uniref:G_PROTEIN_RECEP_F1_2 domain-containing protein n=1 Tax=Anisakis simplex TaxID=6269 RepID=A0A0M3JZH7_ANISI
LQHHIHDRIQSTDHPYPLLWQSNASSSTIATPIKTSFNINTISLNIDIDTTNYNNVFNSIAHYNNNNNSNSAINLYNINTINSINDIIIFNHNNNDNINNDNIIYNDTLTHSCPNSPWPSSCLSLIVAIVTIAFMLTVMLGIVLGNSLVVLTVHNDAKLRTHRQNWLIVSLAIADLLVGLLVMPLTLTYEIIGEWKLGTIFKKIRQPIGSGSKRCQKEVKTMNAVKKTFQSGCIFEWMYISGKVLCELWLALDVLFVTASILHICVISLDRYWSITQPLQYPNKRRTPLRIAIMIGTAWLLSLLICLPPILGWRPRRAPGECSVSTDIGYVLYSSLGSFYIPVVLLVIVYARIFIITKRHSRQRIKETERLGKTLCELAAKAARNSINEASYLLTANTNTTMTNTQITTRNTQLTSGAISAPKFLAEYINNTSTDLHHFDHSQRKRAKIRLKRHTKSEQKADYCLVQTAAAATNKTPAYECTSIRSKAACESKAFNEKRRKLLKAKERQATLLLGLVLSAFIFSWLPFFVSYFCSFITTVIYVLGAFGYKAPSLIFKFFFWLGYCNSGINPIIYTVFNREFKNALCRQLRRQRKHTASIIRRSFHLN